MHMKTPYWFDKHLYDVLQINEAFNRCCLEMKIGDVRKYRASGELLYKTSLIQDGMTGFLVKVDTEVLIICWTDFERICREYKYIGFVLHLNLKSTHIKPKLYYIPHVIKT